MIDKALSASPTVFSREESEVEVPQADDAEAPTTRTEVTFKTTKSGKSPVAEVLDQHSFQTRLFQGAKAVEPPTDEELAARPAAEQPHHAGPSLHLPVAAPAPAIPGATPPVAAVAVAPTTPKPAPAIPSAPVVAQTPAVPAVRPVAPVAPTPAVAQPIATTTTPKPAAPVAAPVTVATPAPTKAPSGPIDFTVADGLTVDLSHPTSEVFEEAGDYFASAIFKALEEDFRFVNFANDWFVEDATTGRFSKNDFGAFGII